jgi:phosphocarrier protein
MTAKADSTNDYSSRANEPDLTLAARVSADREPQTMAEGPASRDVTIHFPVGLHIRPATLIAKKARDFQTEVFLVHDDRRASTKNVFDMFLLGAEKGTQLKLEAGTGPDAQEALTALAALFEPGHPDMHIPTEA